jgi:hypothetical protein
VLLLQIQLELQSSAGYAEVRGGSGVLPSRVANFDLAIGLMANQCAKDCSKCS